MNEDVLEKYREAKRLRDERQAALAEMQPAEAPVEAPVDELALAQEEAKRAKDILKLKSEEAKVNKSARKLSDDEFSDFNLTDDKDNVNYDDVIGQFGINVAPEKSVSGNSVMTPEELAKQPGSVDPAKVMNTINNPIDQIAPDPAMSVSGQPALTPSELGKMDTPVVPEPVAPMVPPVREPATESITPKITPAAPVAPQSAEARLLEAQRKQKLLDTFAAMNQGISNAAAAYGGGSLTRLKGDTSLSNALTKQGATEVQNIKDLNKLKAEESAQASKSRLEKLDTLLKMSTIAKNQKALSGSATSNDPTSPESQAAQAQTMGMMESLGIKFDPEKMKGLSAETLASKNFTAGLRKTVNSLAETREARLTDKFGYTKGQKFQDDARNVLKDMRQTEKWKLSEKTLSEIPNLELLLDDAYKKGGQSLSMLGPKIAKGIAGEVGVLTEQDVTRYVANPEVAQKLIDTLKKVTQGKISKTSYNNLKRLMDISKQAAQKKLDDAIDREAVLFSRRENIPYDDARQYLDNNFMKGDKVQPKVEAVSEAPYGDEVEKDGKVYKWNPSVGKYQIK